jgi:hypothetical protein
MIKKLYKYKYTTQNDLYDIDKSMIIESYVVSNSLQEALDSAFEELSNKNTPSLQYSLLGVEYVPNEVHY